MINIYFLITLVLTAVGFTYVGLHAKRIIARIKPYFTWKKRTPKYEWGKHKLTQQQIFEQIEKRIDLLNKQNSSFHDRMDELEDQMSNVVKSSRTREQNRDRKVKKVVLKYLEELQNGK